MGIKTYYSLWSLLFEPLPQNKGYKYSRGEAFYDLILRQRNNIAANDSECVIGNFQSLAEKWKWHRSTVKKFLTELNSIGAISMTRDTNHTVIRVENVTYSSDNSDGDGRQSHFKARTAPSGDSGDKFPTGHTIMPSGRRKIPDGSVTRPERLKSVPD